MITSDKLRVFIIYGPKKSRHLVRKESNMADHDARSDNPFLQLLIDQKGSWGSIFNSEGGRGNKWVDGWLSVGWMDPWVVEQMDIFGWNGGCITGYDDSVSKMASALQSNDLKHFCIPYKDYRLQHIDEIHVLAIIVH